MYENRSLNNKCFNIFSKGTTIIRLTDRGILNLHRGNRIIIRLDYKKKKKIIKIIYKNTMESCRRIFRNKCHLSSLFRRFLALNIIVIRFRIEIKNKQHWQKQYARACMYNIRVQTWCIYYYNIILLYAITAVCNVSKFKFTFRIPWRCFTTRGLSRWCVRQFENRVIPPMGREHSVTLF